MSKSLLSLFTKERQWANCSHCSLKKGNISDLLVIHANRSQKRAVCFWQLFNAFPLFYKECIAPVTLLSVALYKIASVSESLPFLFTKKQLWTIRSRHSLQKSYRNDSLFFMSELLFYSFAHKKRAIRWKIQGVNSQPCLRHLETQLRGEGMAQGPPPFRGPGTDYL